MEINANGELIINGELTDIEAFPGTSARVKIDTGYSDSAQKGEVILEISAYLKKGTIGHLRDLKSHGSNSPCKKER